MSDEAQPIGSPVPRRPNWNEAAWADNADDSEVVELFFFLQSQREATLRVKEEPEEAEIKQEAEES